MDGSFGETAKALREQAGLSLSRLAKLARYSKSAIGHVETGTREPTQELAKALDKALEANGLLITLASLRRIENRNVDPVNRRDMLKAVTAGTAALGPSALAVHDASGFRFGQSDVDVLLNRTAQLRGLDNSLGGADTYAMYLAETERTHAILKTATYSGRTEKALLAAFAEQAQLAGWAAFDAGWTEQAQIHFDRSQDAAKQAGDSALHSNALALKAYQQAFTGQTDVALTQASCDLLDDTVSPRAQALVQERAAWSFALAGEVASTERCLDRAAVAVSQAGNLPSPDWAAWVDETELQIMCGRCWVALRRPLRAVPILSKTLADFPDAYARDKALYLLALAEAYVHGAEVEQAAVTITRAHALTKDVASTRPKARMAMTLRLLNPVKSGSVDVLRETLRPDQAASVTESRTHLR